MDIEEYEPVSTLHVREHLLTKAKFLMGEQHTMSISIITENGMRTGKCMACPSLILFCGKSTIKMHCM